MLNILSHFSSKSGKIFTGTNEKSINIKSMQGWSRICTPEASVSSFQASSTLITFYFLHNKYDELSHTRFSPLCSSLFSIFLFQQFFLHFSHSSCERLEEIEKSIRDVRLRKEMTASEVKYWERLMRFMGISQAHRCYDTVKSSQNLGRKRKNNIKIRHPKIENSFFSSFHFRHEKKLFNFERTMRKFFINSKLNSFDWNSFNSL